MTRESAYLIAAGFFVLSIIQYFARRSAAKRRAQQWLSQHGYRAASIRTAWLPMMTPTSFYRSNDRAFDFIADVSDRQLGGTGTVRLRVWMGWLETTARDVEVDWIENPSGDRIEDQPLMERLANAQLDILRRVSGGETTFYAPRSSEGSSTSFDETLEHINALESRGMLLCGPPVEDGRPGRGRYSSVGPISVTAEGRKWLESQTTQSPQT